MTSTRAERFRLLCETAACCTLCPRLASRRPILGEANGPIDSPVAFVGEAPGRLGADVTGVPLKGDRTGQNFDALLGNIGWSRQSVFITNAVLCNPRGEDETNATPTHHEIRNCADYLAATLDIVDPIVVVPLGTVALRALAHIHSHQYGLSEHVGKLLPWGTRHVFPLYHPGARAQVHRPFARQVRDFYALAGHLDLGKGELRRRRRRVPARTLELAAAPSPLQRVTAYILSRLGCMSRFRLAKLLYLIDYAWLRQKGGLLTEAFYLSQKAGPWPTVLSRRLGEMASHEVVLSRRGQLVAPGRCPRFAPDLPSDEAAVVDRVLVKYASLSERELRTRVYLTAPMKRLLRLERQGLPTYNKPVFRQEDFGSMRGAARLSGEQ